VRAKKGFTLVELLVVIAIIALLMSILVPALARVRAQANRMLCSTNMHQWSIGLYGYSGDNDGYFPYNGYDKLPGYLPFDETADITNLKMWTPGYDMAWNSRKVQEFWKKYVMKTSKEIATRKNNVLFCPTQLAHRKVAAGNLDMAMYQGLCGYFWLPYREPSGGDTQANWDDLNMKYWPAGAPAGAAPSARPSGVDWVSKQKLGGRFSRAPIMTDIAQAWMGSTTPGMTKWVGGAGPYSSHVTRDGQPEGQDYMFEDGHVTWIKWKKMGATGAAGRDDRKAVLGAFTPDWDCYYKIPLGQ